MPSAAAQSYSSNDKPKVDSYSPTITKMGTWFVCFSLNKNISIYLLVLALTIKNCLNIQISKHRFGNTAYKKSCQIKYKKSEPNILDLTFFSNFFKTCLYFWLFYWFVCLVVGLQYLYI